MHLIVRQWHIFLYIDERIRRVWGATAFSQNGTVYDGKAVSA